MFHFKIDARNLPDDEFFDLCARLKWTIEAEQKKMNQMFGINEKTKSE